MKFKPAYIFAALFLFLAAVTAIIGINDATACTQFQQLIGNCVSPQGALFLSGGSALVGLFLLVLGQAKEPTEK